MRIKKIFSGVIILVVLLVFYNLLWFFVINPMMVSKSKKKIAKMDHYALLLSDCRKLMEDQHDKEGTIYLEKKDLNKKIPESILKLNPCSISINKDNVYICLHPFPRVGIVAFSKKDENKKFKYGKKCIQGLWSVP